MCLQNYESDHQIEHDTLDFLPKQTSTLNLNILLPQSEITQHFLQWQRYRKYWWSSITTTPSLFSLSDIKYDENTMEVNILANLSWGKQPVEKIVCTPDYFETIYREPVSVLKSTMTLEGALMTLLLDGLSNQTSEEYLRLNRIMAPYKLAFAIDCKDNIKDLQDLVHLLNYKMNTNKISTWLPDLLLPLDEQLRSSRQVGVVYSAILNESTLSNGIFHLINSSTMLKEQIHIADFETYTKLLFR